MNGTLFLIGNGLGRSIDDEYFKFESGMKKAWEELESEEIKKIICEVSKSSEPPKSENELQLIQKNIFSLFNIENEYKNIDPYILEKIKKDTKFISTPYFKYLNSIARYFANYTLTPEAKNFSKAKDFLKKFSDYIKEIKSSGNICHVATLNYDRILYANFLPREKGLLRGYYKDTCLVDGLTDSGFDRSNLKRLNGNNFGWYMHLHGSPLFYTDENGNILKSKEVAFRHLMEDDKDRHHIILCHPDQKYESIKHSPLLTAYFDFFKDALLEAEKIVIIGYGGNDSHVNKAVNEAIKKSKREIFIVERKEEKNKKGEWEDKFGCEIKHIIRETILDFDFKI